MAQAPAHNSSAVARATGALNRVTSDAMTIPSWRSQFSDGLLFLLGGISRQAVAGLGASQPPVTLSANLHGPIVDDPAPIFAQRSDNLLQMSVRLLSIHDAVDLRRNFEPGIKTI